MIRMFTVNNLNYAYSTKFSLKEVSISFKPSVNAIIGPNGAGKSTLIKCMAQLLKYDGEIFYENEMITLKTKHKLASQLSYLPQTSKCDSTLTVYEAVLMGLINDLGIGVSKAQTEEVDEMLSILNLQGISEQKLCQLSGGQLQMVLLAQAIIKKPEILFLDEPLNNLDIHRQFRLLNFVSELSRTNNMITVIVMHDINLASKYADNIAIMHQGKLYDFGKPSDVINEQMLRDIYKIESSVITNSQGIPVIEFLDVA